MDAHWDCDPVPGVPTDPWTAEEGCPANFFHAPLLEGNILSLIEAAVDHIAFRTPDQREVPPHVDRMFSGRIVSQERLAPTVISYDADFHTCSALGIPHQPEQLRPSDLAGQLSRIAADNESSINLFFICLSIEIGFMPEASIPSLRDALRRFLNSVSVDTQIYGEVAADVLSGERGKSLQDAISLGTLERVRQNLQTGLSSDEVVALASSISDSCSQYGQYLAAEILATPAHPCFDPPAFTSFIKSCVSSVKARIAYNFFTSQDSMWRELMSTIDRDELADTERLLYTMMCGHLTQTECPQALPGS